MCRQNLLSLKWILLAAKGGEASPYKNMTPLAELAQETDFQQKLPRIAQVDPTCESPLGHNIGANQAFHDEFSEWGFDVKIYISKRFSSQFRFKKEAEPRLPSIVSYYAPEDVIIDELKTFLIGLDQEVIFFPNVDRVSLEAIALASGQLKGKRLVIRMIAVGEAFYDGEFCPNRFSYFDTLKHIVSVCDVQLSAETAVYAEFVTAKIGFPCEVWPVPLRRKHADLAIVRDVIYFPGSPRGDKGADLLDDLTSHIARRNPDLKIAYQMGGDSTIVLDNRVLLPTHISEEEYNEWLSRSASVVLPYDRDVYRYRGSASLYDAAEYQVPVVSLEGMGLSREIEMFNIGRVFNSVSQIGEFDFLDLVRNLDHKHFLDFSKFRRDAFLRQVELLKEYVAS